MIREFLNLPTGPAHAISQSTHATGLKQSGWCRCAVAPSRLLPSADLLLWENAAVSPTWAKHFNTVLKQAETRRNHRMNSRRNENLLPMNPVLGDRFCIQLTNAYED
jgi:hypothetical protein